MAKVLFSDLRGSSNPYTRALCLSSRECSDKSDIGVQCSILRSYKTKLMGFKDNFVQFDTVLSKYICYILTFQLKFWFRDIFVEILRHIASDTLGWLV